CPGLTPQQEIARAEAAEPNCPAGTSAQLYVAVGTDDATTWSLVPVARSSNNEVPVWPVTAAVDPAGRVYVAWSDNHDAWLQVSSNGGTSWTTPVRLNAGMGTAVDPTVATTGDGAAVVAWYGASTTGDSNDST